MLKKVFPLVLPIIFLVFYGCSSMKHSTIVLYVSHKVEGPLYMPEPEPPVEAQTPQTERANQSSEPAQTSQTQGRRPSRNQTAQENQTNQSGQESSRSAREQANQQQNSGEPAQTSQTQERRPSRNQAAQENQANQSNQPTQTSVKSQESSRPAREQANQQQSSGEPAQTNKTQIRRPSRGSRNQNTQTTNTYKEGYQTRTLPRGEFLILEKPIRFAFEKYSIGRYYDDTIEYMANFMKENTNFQLVVEGHTDRVGEYGFNRNLSLMRSRSAISKLVRAGVERNRLIESGVSYRFSEYNFNRLNRRIEFIIIRSPEELAKYREEIKEE